MNKISKKLFFLYIFSFLVLFKSVVLADVQGILIPFYIYPTSTAIQPLLDAKSLHPDVPMRVILNPDNGPGSSQDPTYVTAITSLHNAGIQVAGYVYTNNDTRAIGDVEADIASWSTLYSPDGIFLDAMGTSSTYYTTLTTYTKGLGMQFAIGNAGGNVSTSYATEVDTVVIANGNYLPNLSTYSNWQTSGLPKTDSAMILYGITTFPAGFIYQAKQISGWIYVTDGDVNFDALPSYFTLLMAALDTVNVGTIFPFYIYSTASAIAPLITLANQYPEVPIWVILDPATGPGTSIDPTYTNAITQLRAAGIVILGYLNTNYSHRSKSLVESDISKWMTWYNPDGIFLDLMSVNHAYYSSITSYAKGLGAQIVDANPGTNINASAGADVDIVNIYENNSLPAPITQFSNWYTVYPPSNLSIICYNIATLPTTFITQAAQYFGWIFITDDNDVDPYDAYPAYFSDFIALLSTL